MANITLQFGKYKGWTFENIVKSDREYLVWLAKADISRQNASKEALDFLGGRATSFANRYSKDELEWLEEEKKREAEEVPEKLCWSVPVPGCSALRFIEIFFCKEDGEFCMMINSQFSSHSLDSIQPCEVPGKPEIVARIGKVGLTAERRDALLEMAGVKSEPKAEDQGSLSAKVRKSSKKQVSPAVAAMQLPEGKKVRLVRGKLVVK